MSATRADVALIAGVSPAVVSYVLNNGPRPVSAENRKKVLDAVEQLDYRPNALASALSSKRSGTVGLLTSTSEDPFMGSLVAALVSGFFEYGSSALTGIAGKGPGREAAFIRSFANRRIDALVLTQAPRVDLRELLGSREVPIVTVAAQTDIESITSVDMDHQAAAQSATYHLHDHSRTTIALIAGTPLETATSQRVTGWRLAQESIGVEHDPSLQLSAERSFEGGYLGALALLSPDGGRARRGQTADGIVVSSDAQASGVLAACHYLGLSVPQNVSVISLEGTQMGRFTIPTLSAIQYPLDAVVDIAVRTALGKMSMSERSLSLRGHLLLGESCGCGRVAGQY